MKTYRLLSPDVLAVSPHWLRLAQATRQDAVVDSACTVVLDGHSLSFRDESLAPGTAVKVWLNDSGFFVCAEEAEVQAEKARRDAAVRAQVEAEARQRQQDRERAELINSRLNIPVEWSAGIKDVMSGLSDKSSGNGGNKSTVVHVLLRGDIREGRFLRVAGDFLCTAAKGSNGLNLSQQPEVVAVDATNTRYRPAPTCKACLRLATRWAQGAGQQ